MPKSFHHNTNSSTGDYHYFKMESDLDADIKIITDNGFQFNKPIKSQVVMIDNFRLMKHEEKLIIQKGVGGVFTTLLTLE